MECNIFYSVIKYTFKKIIKLQLSFKKKMGLKPSFYFNMKPQKEKFFIKQNSEEKMDRPL